MRVVPERGMPTTKIIRGVEASSTPRASSSSGVKSSGVKSVARRFT